MGDGELDFLLSAFNFLFRISNINKLDGILGKVQKYEDTIGAEQLRRLEDHQQDHAFESKKLEVSPQRKYSGYCHIQQVCATDHGDLLPDLVTDKCYL